MSIGLPVGKSDLDFAVGRAAQAVVTAFTQVQALKAYLDGMTTAALQGLPLGQDPAAVAYTEGEVANLKAAVNDLDQLRAIFEGAATLQAAKDFRTFVRQVTGVGF